MKAFIPAIIWAAAVLALSGISAGALPKGRWWQFEGADKIVHAGLYFVLACLLLYGFHRAGRLRKTTIAATVLGATLYGALMEVAQHYLFIGRSFEWADILANAAGAVASLMILNLFFNKNLVSYVTRDRNRR